MSDPTDDTPASRFDRYLAQVEQHDPEYRRRERNRMRRPRRFSTADWTIPAGLFILAAGLVIRALLGWPKG